MQLAIMCISDLVQAFGDDMVALLDVGGAASPVNSLLSQLLLKATSNDKRFVVEEALRSLEIIAQHVRYLPACCTWL